jgi:4'-phosphopantetheinyl transferase
VNGTATAADPHAPETGYVPAAGTGARCGGGGSVVRVWLVRDDPPPELGPDELTAVLDDEERRRAGAIALEAERRRFTVAHAAVRFIVGARLGVPAREVRWDHGPHGKPEPAGDPTGTRVNLSHSGALTMVAVTGSRQVGVDIQRLARDVDVCALAERFFPPDEAASVLLASGAGERAELFTRLWARKEAVVKACGGRLLPHGIAVPVAVPGPVEVGPAVTAAGEPGGSRGAAPLPYRVADVPTVHGFRAAVALSGAEDFRIVLRRWRWPGESAVRR